MPEPIPWQSSERWKLSEPTVRDTPDPAPVSREEQLESVVRKADAIIGRLHTIMSDSHGIVGWPVSGMVAPWEKTWFADEVPEWLEAMAALNLQPEGPHA